MQSSYKGYYFEEGPHGVVFVYASADDWREQKSVFSGDSESTVKAWVDQVVEFTLPIPTAKHIEYQPHVQTTQEYVPHTYSVGWVRKYWPLLQEYCKQHDILSDSGGIDECIEVAVKEKQLTRSEVYDYKVCILGYFLLANNIATDREVAETFSVMKRELFALVPYYIKNRGIDIRTGKGIEEVRGSNEYKDWWIPLIKLYSTFKRAVTRTDKALAIDNLMHIVHTDKSLLDDMFGIFMAEISDIVNQILQALSE